MYKINHANIKDWAANYDGELFDAILCDPPYELGFMGKSWDSSGIAFDSDMWADLLRILKPGGHLLAFSGSRTYHRMAVAIEDAGFEIRDMIEWVYGSGFPKSLNIGKAVDKIQGNEREVTDYVAPDGKKRWGGNSFSVGEEPDGRGINQATKGTSPYEGYGTALKPAHEPCVLARKPLEKGMTVATNALKHGTGGLNIDGSRVGFGDNEPDKRVGTDTLANGFSNGAVNFGINPKGKNIAMYKDGRFPANLIHDGSDEVVGLFPNDNARFFYTAKASKSERNAGLEGFENNNPPYESHRANYANTKGIDNPRAGAGRGGGDNRNNHPTVKPLSLTKYLANLIKPPTSGRLLVPFSGSGSEMIGALQAGWEYVEGVELTEEYIPIAEARIKHWLDKMSKEQLGLL